MIRLTSISICLQNAVSSINIEYLENGAMKRIAIANAATVRNRHPVTDPDRDRN